MIIYSARKFENLIKSYFTKLIVIIIAIVSLFLNIFKSCNICLYIQICVFHTSKIFSLIYKIHNKVKKKNKISKTPIFVYNVYIIYIYYYIYIITNVN